MKILAIGASNSPNSINRILATYAAQQITGAEVEVLDLNDYELPIFSMEREQRFGQPLQARNFYRKVGDADALVIAFAEHNGTYTAAWKNLFDWVSRIDSRVFQDKPAVFMATSPGGGGARSVLESAVQSATYFGVDLVGQLSVPSFHDNFDLQKARPRNEVLNKQIQQLMSELGMQVASHERADALSSTAGNPCK